MRFLSPCLKGKVSLHGGSPGRDRPAWPTSIILAGIPRALKANQDPYTWAVSSHGVFSAGKFLVY